MSRPAKVFLPRTLEEFEELVDKVCTKFKLPQRDHAAAVISVAIRHLPNDSAVTTLDYLGHTVLKNMANTICNHKASVLQHNSQVQMLFEKLQHDPNDNQARDELEKAAREGSKVAQEALEKLDTSGADPASLAAPGVTH